MEFGTGVADKRMTSVAAEVDVAGSWKRPNGLGLDTEIGTRLKFKEFYKIFNRIKSQGIMQKLSKGMKSSRKCFLVGQRLCKQVILLILKFEFLKSLKLWLYMLLHI